MWLRRKKTSPGNGKRRLAQAQKEAAASLARAKADRAREQEDLSRDRHLIGALQRIRAENHVAEIVTDALRGHPGKAAR